MGPAKRVIGLDCIRATAILVVVFEHFLGFYYGLAGRWCYPLGVLGVEIFFVLSGYLIGGILLDVIARNNNHLTPPLLFNFWARRWLRTLPNYFLFLAVFAAALHNHDGRDLARYATFTQNLFRPVPPFYDLSWSLAVEEWFYLLFPALVLAFGVAPWRTRHKFLAATALLFICPVVARVAFGPGMAWDAGVRKVVSMRLDALMWGVLLAAVRRYAPIRFERLQSPVYPAAGLFLLVVLLAALNLRYPPGGDFTATWADAFWFSGFNLAVALALPFCVAIDRLPGPLAAFVERTSLWSYSMYLCHEPVMWTTRKALHLDRGPMMVVTALGVFVVSAALYYLFELPVLHLRDRFFPSAGRRSRLELVPQPSAG